MTWVPSFCAVTADVFFMMFSQTNTAVLDGTTNSYHVYYPCHSLEWWTVVDMVPHAWQHEQICCVSRFHWRFFWVHVCKLVAWKGHFSNWYCDRWIGPNVVTKYTSHQWAMAHYCSLLFSFCRFTSTKVKNIILMILSYFEFVWLWYLLRRQQLNLGIVV